MKLISIIIPIYNKENVLEKCLETVLNQTWKNIEVILVNDGSIDGSLKICNEYADKDNRIRVINQDNAGVSVARNNGIKIAKGEFIGFVDPDDWIELDMYENMLIKIKETDSQVCMCNYYKDEGNEFHPIMLDFQMEVMDKHQIFNNVLLEMIAPKSVNDKAGTNIWGTVWRLLIKKSVIVENKIYFHEELKIYEDLLFNIEVLLSSERLSVDNNINYHYVQEEESVTHQYMKNKVEVEEYVYDEIIKILKEHNKIDDAKNRINIKYINNTIGIIRNEIINPSSINIKLKNIYRVCKNPKVNIAINSLNKNNLLLKKKIILNALKRNRAVLLYLIYSVAG